MKAFLEIKFQPKQMNLLVKMAIDSNTTPEVLLEKHLEKILEIVRKTEQKNKPLPES